LLFSLTAEHLDIGEGVQKFKTHPWKMEKIVTAVSRKPAISNWWLF